MDQSDNPVNQPEPLEAYKTLNRVRKFGIDLIAIASFSILLFVATVALIIVRFPLEKLGFFIVSAILALPLSIFGVWGWRLAILDLGHLDRAKQALKHVLSIKPRISSATRSAGLFDLARDEAMNIEKKIDYLMNAFPSPGELEQVMAQFKTTEQYNRMRNKRRIYVALIVVLVVLATSWVVTHWSN